MAATGAYNLGDELIVSEEVRFVRSHYGNSVDITVFTYDRASSMISDPDIQYKSYFPNNIGKNPFWNIWYLIQNILAIWKADVLVIGWGGIIFDNEPGVSFGAVLWQWFMRIKLARIAGTTLLFWWISLEVNQVKNKMQLKKLFTPGDFILVRDARSKWLLDALEIPSIQVQDIVFLYETKKIDILPTAKKRVWISIRGGFLSDNERYIPEIYDFLITSGYEPVFLVFSTSGEIDQNDSLYIKKIMAGKTYNVTKTIQQTLDVFPWLYAVVGMRFHAGVLSCIHNIPYIPISYGSKTDELVKALEIETLSISPNEISLELFQNMWHTLTENYESEKQKITGKHQEFHNSLKKHLETL